MKEIIGELQAIRPEKKPQGNTASQNQGARP
jgi:hypothetical protein